VQLILQAAARARRRGSYSAHGAPVRILDWLKNHSGFMAEPHKDIAIEFTGLKAPEKLHEELMETTQESMGRTIPYMVLTGLDGRDVCGETSTIFTTVYERGTPKS